MTITVPKKPAIRVNDRIRIPQVRVIDDEGNQLGIMSNTEALSLAQEKGMDLVEISPTARPPVCKIMDYGKFKYEESKQARKARRNQHVMQIKEVKLRPKIDDHDYDFKVNHAREFLSHRDKVKFTVTFRGREMVHMELGRRILDDVVKDLAHEGGEVSTARFLRAVNQASGRNFTKFVDRHVLHGIPPDIGSTR